MEGTFMQEILTPTVGVTWINTIERGGALVYFPDVAMYLRSCFTGYKVVAILCVTNVKVFDSFNRSPG